MGEKVLIELRERLVRIEAKLDYHKEEIDELKDNNKWSKRIIMSTFLTMVISAFTIYLK